MNKISPNTVSNPHSTLPTESRKTVLPNGLRIVTEEIPYVRSISFGLWIDVGSRDERVHNNGISHFVEHMVFKGTKHFSLQAIARSLESDGGYLNAFTSKEHTCFYARSLDVHLPKAVDVVADLVRHPLFERKEIEKERLVVLEEFKNLEDDPDELIHDYFDDRLFHDHPLRFPVLGKTKNVESFTREMLCEWKREHYVPGKMVIAAAGNLKHETVVALVEKHFGSGSSRHGTVRRPHQPRSHHPCKAVFDRPILQAHLCMGTLGCSVRAHQRYPLMVMNTLLGEGMSSRLFQNLRERHGLAYTVYSFVNTMSDTGNFGVYAATDAKNVDRSIELITKVFDKLRSMPVGPTELRRTKSQLKGMMMLSLESMSSRMMRLGSGELYYGTNIPLDEIIRKIDAVEADEVFEVSKNFLKVEDFTTVIFRPKASELQ